MPAMERSIAVLPFANASGDAGQQFFSDGLSDNLIDALSRFEGLRVIGRMSSFRFRDEQEDGRAIGAKLGATYLVGGSVQRAGGMVRISAALTRAADGSVGVDYQASITAEGGAPPYVFSVASGTLPGGLTFTPDGTLFGRPTSAGTSSFAIQVTDASSPAQLALKSFTLTINPGNGEALSILTTSLPDGSVDTSYTAMLAATGGQPPYAWSLAAGTSLPSGLVLDAYRASAKDLAGYQPPTATR